MQKELENTVALITGAGRGIGKAIALSLAVRGAEVVICGRTESSLKNTVHEIEGVGGSAHFFVLDATDHAQVKNMFDQIITKIGRLDILVNNVGGVQEHEKFLGLEDKHWERAFQFNFMSAVYFIREAFPYLEKSKNARIINISSVASKQPGAFNPHYGAAKAALNNLSKHLANDWASKNILVNTICPTTVKGGIWEEHVADKARRMNVAVREAEIAMEEEVRSKTPTGTIGTPEDIANLVAFLASPRAKFITGACIQVDGGYIKTVF